MRCGILHLVFFFVVQACPVVNPLALFCIS